MHWACSPLPVRTGAHSSLKTSGMGLLHAGEGRTHTPQTQGTVVGARTHPGASSPDQSVVLQQHHPHAGLVLRVCSESEPPGWGGSLSQRRQAQARVGPRYSGVSVSGGGAGTGPGQGRGLTCANVARREGGGGLAGVWSEEWGQCWPWVLSTPFKDLVSRMMERVQHRGNQIAEECHLAFKH